MSSMTKAQAERLLELVACGEAENVGSTVVHPYSGALTLRDTSPAVGTLFIIDPNGSVTYDRFGN